MMNNIHCLLRWIISCVLVLSVSACADNTGSTSAEKSPIIVGDISTYAGLEAFMHPYRNGWKLAVAELNSSGGINGRDIVVISREDNGDKQKALEIARDLKDNDGAMLIFGASIFGIGNALSDFAESEKTVFLASLPMENAVLSPGGKTYTFRLRPSSQMQAAMLADEAAKLPAKRWATVALNYDFGKDAVASFKAALKQRRPDVEFVNELWPDRSSFDAPTIISSLQATAPDAIFNATFGSDLTAFADGGQEVGLFNKISVVSMIAGEPEYAGSINVEAVQNDWIVSGYPWYDVVENGHPKFVENYRNEYGVPPTNNAFIGYVTVQVIAEAFTHAKDDSAESLSATMASITIPSIAGNLQFRENDHQASLGAWIGRLASEEGQVFMTDHSYVDGAEFMPEYASQEELITP